MIMDKVVKPFFRMKKKYNHILILANVKLSENRILDITCEIRGYDKKINTFSWKDT